MCRVAVSVVVAAGVVAVPSVTVLLNASWMVAVWGRVAPEVMAVVRGERAMCWGAAGVMCRVAVSVVVAAPASVPVTVWSAATVEVQVWVTSSQLEPAVGLMVNKVLAVLSPRALSGVSTRSVLYGWEPPAVMVAGSGLMTMWS